MIDATKARFKRSIFTVQSIFFSTEFTFSNKRSLYKKRPWVLYEKSLIGMLYQTVMDARAGSQEAAEYLLGRFSPLLYGYARKLYKEDAFEDIQCDFWEVIMQAPLENLRVSEDCVLIRYFEKAVQSKFIKRLKKVIDGIRLIIGV